MTRVSIIVVTYNAKWEKLKLTINSILLQSGIDYEIIFADDGSAYKLNEKIQEYIQNNCIYRFADSAKNVGTVMNILNGVEKAEGEYIKVISPGDCFYDQQSLKEWVAHIEKNKVDLSFCDAIYYRNIKNTTEIVKSKASPKNVYLYYKDNYHKLFIDYLLANDSILGASVLIKKSVILQYLQEMAGKVIYAEDYMIRIMIYDNKLINHFNKTCLWYEYGDGISTSNDNKWAELLHKDFEETNKIIKKRNLTTDKIHKKYKRLVIDKEKRSPIYKIKKALFFPTVIWYRLRMKWFYCVSPSGNIDKLSVISEFKPRCK